MPRLATILLAMPIAALGACIAIVLISSVLRLP